MFPQGPISTVCSKMILSDTLVTGLGSFEGIPSELLGSGGKDGVTNLLRLCHGAGGNVYLTWSSLPLLL